MQVAHEQGKLYQIFMKGAESIVYLSNIYRISIVYLSCIYRVSIVFVGSKAAWKRLGSGCDGAAICEKRVSCLRCATKEFVENRTVLI